MASQAGCLTIYATRVEHGVVFVDLQGSREEAA